MIETITLETDRLLLRPPTINDAARISELTSDWDVAKTTLNMPYPNPVEEVEAFIGRIAEGIAGGNDYTFALYLKETGDLIGMMGIHRNVRHNRAEIGYWVGKAYWGNGYATEACQRIVRFGFDELDVNRVEASYFVGNEASRRVMEKAGMVFEGIKPQFFRRTNESNHYDQYVDVGFCGLLRQDWHG